MAVMRKRGNPIAVGETVKGYTLLSITQCEANPSIGKYRPFDMWTFSTPEGGNLHVAMDPKDVISARQIEEHAFGVAARRRDDALALEYAKMC